MTAASSTEPIVGASVCASGSHVWNGHIGTFTANPRAIAPNTTSWRSCEYPPLAPKAVRVTRSNVCCPATWGPLKYRARNPSSMNTEPNSVYRKNLIDAYWRLADPQTPIRKYIGTSTSSQKTKNRIRSSAMKVPAMPVISSRVSATNAFTRPGSGTNRHVYTAHRNPIAKVRRYSGIEMPSIPTWYRALITGIQVTFSTNWYPADP